MSVPTHADVIVLNRPAGVSTLPRRLVPERRPLRKPGPGEVVVRNLVTTVDPYQLRMLRGSPEVTLHAVGEPVPANGVGVVAAPEALATVFDRGSPYIGRRVVRISEG